MRKLFTFYSSTGARLWIKNLYRSSTGKYQLRSFSQEGEDRILDRMLEGKKVGFYVDVGAHHPVRFSNTYLFYLRGWRGINIDATPGSMRAFQKQRAKDLNLEIGIGNKAGIRTLYRFSDPALNSFDSELSHSRDATNNPFKIVGTSEVTIKPLADILRDYVPAGKEIDFLTVDAEGFDLAVIMSNDWSIYRPKIILAESLMTDLQSLIASPLAVFLMDKGYEPIAKTLNTTFFRRMDSA